VSKKHVFEKVAVLRRRKWTLEEMENHVAPWLLVDGLEVPMSNYSIASSSFVYTSEDSI
jgi:hypothetical protein